MMKPPDLILRNDIHNIYKHLEVGCEYSIWSISKSQKVISTNNYIFPHVTWNITSSFVTVGRWLKHWLLWCEGCRFESSFVIWPCQTKTYQKVVTVPSPNTLHSEVRKSWVFGRYLNQVPCHGSIASTIKRNLYSYDPEQHAIRSFVTHTSPTAGTSQYDWKILKNGGKK